MGRIDDTVKKVFSFTVEDVQKERPARGNAAGKEEALFDDEVAYGTGRVHSGRGSGRACGTCWRPLKCRDTILSWSVHEDLHQLEG